MYLCTRSTACIVTVTLKDPEEIVGAVKSGVSRHLKSRLEARIAKVTTELKKLRSCEMRGGAGVQDKLVLVLLGVVWLINLSACQIG